FEREFPASHSDVIVDECLQLTTGIANGYGKKRVLMGDDRRAELYVERGFVLEYTPDLEFVAVNSVYLPAQQTLDRSIPVPRLHHGCVGKIPVCEIHIGTAGNDTEPPIIFLQDLRRRAPAGFATNPHPIEHQRIPHPPLGRHTPHTFP